MVQWKGEIGEESGRKAQLLDGLEQFNVPNFFVIKPDEVGRLFNGEKDPEAVLNASINRSIKREIKDAYDDVGMSSAVREASGKAKSLVGGQRNNQFVSIRISGSEKEKYTYKLNVGGSSFFESLREVVSSYYAENSDHPAVMVQKMVEPGYTGALESNGRETVIEAVSGLGISLEEGLTVPHVYHLRNSQLQKTITAEEQLEISRNPVRGENQRQKIKDDDKPFSREDVEDLAEKASRKNLNLKFVYKRGGFHVIDAYQSSDEDRGFIVSKKGLRASRGEISGRIGQNVVFNDQTLPPEEYPDALIAQRGGYTSRDGYRARKQDKPSVFQFRGQLRNGQKIRLESAEVEVKETSQESSRPSSSGHFDSTRNSNPFQDEEKSSEDISEQVLAMEVLPIDPRTGRGVCLKRKSDHGYVVTDRRTEAEQIPESCYISSFEAIFAFEGEKAVVDARRLSDRGLKNAVKYLEADLKILLVDNPDKEILRAVVDSGYDVIGTSEDSVDEVSARVAGEEKRFIMEKLRDL